jgi:plasmid rolling circle replication initiator protein Rep
MQQNTRTIAQRSSTQGEPIPAHHSHDKGSIAPSPGHCKNENQKRVFAKEYKPFNKLAVSGTEQEKKSLISRAKAKDFTYHLVQSLMMVPNTPLWYSYRNTKLCAWQIFKEGDKKTSKYCGNRWCLVCNRIRCMKLIKSYVPQLEKLADPYFVTLTIPNVYGHLLRQSIRQMKRNFSTICGKHKKRHQRGKQDWKVNGLLKIECTYNRQLNNFHPHFHVVVDGNEAAKALVRDWLETYPRCSKKAQKIVEAKTGTEKEMFKYFAKIVTPTDKGWGVYVAAMDTIFCSMRGMDTFTNVGDVRPVSEGIEEIQAVQNDDYSYGYSEYVPELRDWVDTETGELETGYVRSQTLDEIINNFI